MIHGNDDPTRLRPPEGLLLGRRLARQTATGFGAARVAPTTAPGEPVYYAGQGHLLTIAPTGAGKGRGLVIPTLLSSDRPAIVVDPKGEACTVTAAARRAMGHRVVRLDPFGVVSGADADALNPLDLLELAGADADSDAESLAHVLSEGHRFSSDPYWTDTANALNGGLLAHVAGLGDVAQRHLVTVRDLLFHEDVDVMLARLLDADQVPSPLARRQLIAYLQIPGDRTRPCVLSTARSSLGFLSSRRVADALQRSTFPLQELIDDRPLTVYLVLPPDKLDSHRPLLRLWVHALLLTVMRRPVLPVRPTLFLIDEAAQLGTLPALRTALTYLRGVGGLQVWTLWQDLSQIERLYPDDWETVLDNCAVLSTFGVGNPLMAARLAPVFGQPPEALLCGAASDELLVYLAGHGFERLRRLDYLADAEFAARYAANPRFATRAGSIADGSPIGP